MKKKKTDDDGGEEEMIIIFYCEVTPTPLHRVECCRVG